MYPPVDVPANKGYVSSRQDIPSSPSNLHSRLILGIFYQQKTANEIVFHADESPDQNQLRDLEVGG